ncbi:MAG: carboxypeptidase-like regulatory domain-containing protein, partial [Planctomycetota bacterium]
MDLVLWVAFAAPHWLPLVKEGDVAPPPAAVLQGVVTGPGKGGPFFADLFDLSEVDWLDELKPMRRAFLEGYGEFSLPVPEEGVYLVLPTSVRDPVLPSRGMVLAVGKKGDLGDLTFIARASLDSGAVLDSIRVDRGASVSVRLELRQAGTVRGSVRDRAGAPCSGATVDVRPARQGGGRGRKFVRTDASGSFEAPGILGNFQAEVSAPDGSIGRAEGTVGPGEVAVLKILAGKTGTLCGTVVGADGLPVAGAEVRAMTDREWRTFGLRAKESHSDA